MKQLLGNGVFDITPIDSGLIVVDRKPDPVKGVQIIYEYVPSSNPNNVRSIAKQTYASAKYRDRYDDYKQYIGHYLIPKIAPVSNDSDFIMLPNGESFLFVNGGKLKWHGNITYKDESPADIAVYGNNLWCSFASNNSLVRFDLRTMREELRIGGSEDSAFNMPKGIWADRDTGHLFVCNTGSNSITELLYVT
ncbi:MAG: hypothetical protein MJ212_05065 [Alphaproteobacteria bacterium]|nr:hypothetical protein [Alphaproteobacteria bacterium]